jgi:hypothetical protein
MDAYTFHMRFWASSEQSQNIHRFDWDCGYSAGHNTAFSGTLDLGSLAKDQNITIKATIRLADLVALILYWYLPKGPTICVSTEWANPTLTQHQINHAALNIFTTWEVFKTLIARPVGQRVNSSSPGGLAISLCSPAQSVIVAHGYIAPDHPKKYCGINITKTQVLINVTPILVPGYIVPAKLLPSQTATPFTAFPSLPFFLVSKAKHVQSRLKTTTPPAFTHRPPIHQLSLKSGQMSLDQSLQLWMHRSCPTINPITPALGTMMLTAQETQNNWLWTLYMIQQQSHKSSKSCGQRVSPAAMMALAYCDLWS